MMEAYYPGGRRHKNIYLNSRPNTEEIQALQADRQKCAMCGKARSIRFESVLVYSGDAPTEEIEKAEKKFPPDKYILFYNRYTGKWWQAHWYGNDTFCSLQCCERFAAASYRAGYRRKTQ